MFCSTFRRSCISGFTYSAKCCTCPFATMIKISILEIKYVEGNFVLFQVDEKNIHTYLLTIGVLIWGGQLKFWPRRFVHVHVSYFSDAPAGQLTFGLYLLAKSGDPVSPNSKSAACNGIESNRLRHIIAVLHTSSKTARCSVQYVFMCQVCVGPTL